MQTSEDLEITLVRPLNADNDDLWLVNPGQGSQGPAEMRARKFDKTKLHTNGEFHALKQSVEVAQNINHDNVTRVYGYSESQGDIYVLMEHVHGLSVSELLSQLDKSQKTMDPRLIVWLIREVVRILNELKIQTEKCETGFGLGFDLNLNRVLTSRSGQVKLTDLGRSSSERDQGQVTNVLNMLATLSRTATEELQIDNKRIVSRDIFSDLLSASYASLKDLERKLERIFFGVYRGEDDHHGAHLLRNLVVGFTEDTVSTDETPTHLDSPQLLKDANFKGEFTRALESRHEPVVPQALTYADRVTGFETTGTYQPDTNNLAPPHTVDSNSVQEPRLMTSMAADESSPTLTRLVWFTLGFASAIVSMIAYLSVIS
jgi:serine/threonine protein kinase